MSGRSCFRSCFLASPPLFSHDAGFSNLSTFFAPIFFKNVPGVLGVVHAAPLVWLRPFLTTFFTLDLKLRFFFFPLLVLFLAISGSWVTCASCVIFLFTLPQEWRECWARWCPLNGSQIWEILVPVPMVLRSSIALSWLSRHDLVVPRRTKQVCFRKFAAELYPCWGLFPIFSNRAVISSLPFF